MKLDEDELEIVRITKSKAQEKAANEANKREIAMSQNKQLPVRSIFAATSKKNPMLIRDVSIEVDVGDDGDQEEGMNAATTEARRVNDSSPAQASEGKRRIVHEDGRRRVVEMNSNTNNNSNGGAKSSRDTTRVSRDGPTNKLFSQALQSAKRDSAEGIRCSFYYFVYYFLIDHFYFLRYFLYSMYCIVAEVLVVPPNEPKASNREDLNFRIMVHHNDDDDDDDDGDVEAQFVVFPKTKSTTTALAGKSDEKKRALSKEVVADDDFSPSLKKPNVSVASVVEPKTTTTTTKKSASGSSGGVLVRVPRADEEERMLSTGKSLVQQSKELRQSVMRDFKSTATTTTATSSRYNEMDMDEEEEEEEGDVEARDYVSKHFLSLESATTKSNNNILQHQQQHPAKSSSSKSATTPLATLSQLSSKPRLSVTVDSEPPTFMTPGKRQILLPTTTQRQTVSFQSEPTFNNSSRTFIPMTTTTTGSQKQQSVSFRGLGATNSNVTRANASPSSSSSASLPRFSVR
jgi:hypothetical protein